MLLFGGGTAARELLHKGVRGAAHLPKEDGAAHGAAHLPKEEKKKGKNASKMLNNSRNLKIFRLYSSGRLLATG